VVWVARLVHQVLVVEERTVMHSFQMVVTVVWVAIQVQREPVELVVLDRPVARVVPTAQQSHLVVTAAMVATGITRALISTRLLERRVVLVVTEDQPAVWVMVAMVAMAATARRAATVQMA
jgi:antitoxin (DNA-binding transcriptional repressor) of toxin-antitoxin stability system